jgi:hypothetical protein
VASLQATTESITVSLAGWDGPPGTKTAVELSIPPPVAVPTNPTTAVPVLPSPPTASL